MTETVLTRHELAKMMCHARYHVVEEAEQDSASGFELTAMLNCTPKSTHTPRRTARDTDTDTCKGVRMTSSQDTEVGRMGCSSVFGKPNKNRVTHEHIRPRTPSQFAQNENKEEYGRERERNCELVKTRYRERPMVRCKQWRFGCHDMSSLFRI